MDEMPEFSDVVDVLRERLDKADAVLQGQLHNVRELLAEYEGKIPPKSVADAFEELRTQGHLHPSSSYLGGGAIFATLSADGRAYLRFGGDA